MIGAYQPRSRRSQMADRLEDWRRALVHALNTAVLRGAGAALFLASVAGFAALLSYSANDASLNNASSGEASNLLGGLGATAADLLLQTFGLAAVAALLPPCVWGARALLGRGITNAVWRAVAWPTGAVLMAAGFGLIPAPFTLPARSGGLIGEALVGILGHLRVHWIGIVIPLAALLVSLPLAFFATGLRFRHVVNAATRTPALVARTASWIRMPAFFTRHDKDEVVDDEEYEDTEEYDDDEEGDYGLGVKPEPVAARTGKASGRVRREENRKAAAKPKPPRQPAFNLASGEYQLPALGLLAEPVRLHDATSLSD